MDIVIVAQYLRNIENFEGNNSRFVYLAKMLAQDDTNRVEIITSDYSHGMKQHFGGVGTLENIKVTTCHESGYPKNICLKRFFSHKQLSKNVTTYLYSREKPDVIYAAVPSLAVAEACAEYCKRCKVRFIVDVQDLWPEAFKMILNIPIVSDLCFAPMVMQANKIYFAADEIVAVSKTYADRALRVNKKCNEAHSVFLGTDLSDFDRYRDKNRVKKPEGEIWVAYIGTLGASYDLVTVIQAMSTLKENCKDKLKLVVMGDGPRKQEFEELATQASILCEFTGTLPYPEMVNLLCKCDIAVNPIVSGSVGSIINKVGDYAAAGLPVVNTQDFQEYRYFLDSYKCGINCPCCDVISVAQALLELIHNPEQRQRMGQQSRKLAEDRFDRANNYRRLVNLIQKN